MAKAEAFIGKMTPVDAANAGSVPLHKHTIKKLKKNSATFKLEVVVGAFNQQRETEQRCGKGDRAFLSHKRTLARGGEVYCTYLDKVSTLNHEVLNHPAHKQYLLSQSGD